MTSEDRPAPAGASAAHEGNVCPQCGARPNYLAGGLTRFECGTIHEEGKSFDEADECLRRVCEQQEATIASLRQQLAEATQYQEAWGKLRTQIDESLSMFTTKRPNPYADGYEAGIYRVQINMAALIPAAPAEAGKQQEDGQ